MSYQQLLEENAKSKTLLALHIILRVFVERCLNTTRVFLDAYTTVSMTDENDLVKRAATMLLNGATLLGQPCPYCKGVRVLKDGDALCVNCGQEPEERQLPQDCSDNGTISDGANMTTADAKTRDYERDTAYNDMIGILEDKLVTLSKELAAETDRQKEIEILDSLSATLSTLEKARHSLETNASKVHDKNINR